MLTNPHCPACASTDWVPLSERTYHCEDAGRSAYETVRYEVLFHLWNDSPERVCLRTVACARCGFSTFLPRPTDDEITRKYEYINSHPASASEFRRDLPTDRIRSKELFRTLKPLLRTLDAEILDFGGGKGRLLHSFVASGYRCSVIDYVDSVLPGVEYLGNDLSALPGDSRFDIVICSHVIEHLAEPRAVIRALRGRLKRDGKLYVEVPLEIWKRAPPSTDPVTHINFFTKESLRTLMEASGLTVLRCGYGSFTRPNGRIGIAIKAIGEISGDHSEKPLSYAGIAPVTRLLKPSHLDRLMRIAAHPRLLTNTWK